MTRVSLKEAYDNKDVVAQIYAIRDIAEGASDTADSAKTTADDAKTYVDTLGAQVEGAVQTANNASASAQTSAQTVSQYDARLTEAEGGLNQAESDIDGLETGLNAVTLRVTTAEGNIVTIQGRVTALETADGQNVKINNIAQYAVTLTDNQDVFGTKRYDALVGVPLNKNIDNGTNGTVGYYKTIFKIPRSVSYGIRNHLLICVNTRARNSAPDILSLYMSGSEALGLMMVVRANGNNYTYVLSQDSEYIRIAFICAGTPADGVQTTILDKTDVTHVFNTESVVEISETVIGTEVSRVTP